MELVSGRVLLVFHAYNGADELLGVFECPLLTVSVEVGSAEAVLIFSAFLGVNSCKNRSYRPLSGWFSSLVDGSSCRSPLS